MKALIKGSLAFMLLCLFSCTKNGSFFTGDESSLLRGGGASQANADIAPALVVNFNPDPAIVNQPVTVTGTFNTTTVAAPQCGKLQLFQKINGSWVAVGSQVNVTPSVQSVSYTFTPTLIGTDVYEFKVNFIKAGCAGYSTEASSSFFLTVVQPCNGLTLVGTATGVPSIDAPGMYDFTVDYTVTACNISYDALKLQGGLTAASVLVGATNGYTWEVGNGPNPNSIIKWTESSPFPGTSKTYTATFRKAYSGSGTITITGAWSVKTTLNGVETGVSQFPPINFN